MDMDAKWVKRLALTAAVILTATLRPVSGAKVKPGGTGLFGIADEKLAEELGHTERLYEQELDLNSVVFDNEDNSMTVYLFKNDVKQKTASGGAADKNISLQLPAEKSAGTYLTREDIYGNVPELGVLETAVAAVERLARYKELMSSETFTELLLKGAVMSVYLNMDAAGYEPFAVIEAAKTLKLNVTYDNGYYSRFAMADTRIRVAFNTVKAMYLDRFSINISNQPETKITSRADDCTSAYSSLCTCVPNGLCYDSTNSQVFLQHHKNYYGQFYRIPAGSASTSGNIHFCGHLTCSVEGANECKQKGTYGTANASSLRIIIHNFETVNGTNKERKTLAHEIGHLYGVADHYGIDNVPGSVIKGQDAKCIYGEKKEDADVVDGLLLCDYCEDTIARNASRFNQ